MAIKSIVMPAELDSEAVVAISASFREAAEDPSVKTIVLEGHDGIFCHGLDMKALVNDKEVIERAVRAFSCLINSLLNFPKPVIAKVDGDAFAGGLGIAASTDYIAASANSRFALPEAMHGLVPSVIMPALLQRLTPQKIRRLTLSCHSISASEAMGIGLVDTVVDVSELDKVVQFVARQMNRAFPESVRTLRKILSDRSAYNIDVAEAITVSMLINSQHGK